MFSDGLEYLSLDSEHSAVCGLGECGDVDIAVPEYSPDGKKVIAIYDNAFYKCHTIRSLTLPDSVTHIGNCAFAFCSSLQRVVTDRLETLGSRAFSGCGNLEDFRLPDSLVIIGEKSFAYCSSFTAISLPDNVVSLGVGAFEGCTSLICVSLSENLKILPNSAFCACSSLAKIERAGNLKYIDEYAFAFCSSLKHTEISNKTVINSDAFFRARIA